jgi:hypothetical protein
MGPTLLFHAVGRKPSLIRQTKNLREWWELYQQKIFDAFDWYVSVKWKIDEIEVALKHISKRGHSYDCEGEVDVSKPNVINLYIGSKVRWTPRSLVVFVHELIHCATSSGEDLRFNEPGVLEEWIYDELAADLLAQHILKRAGINYRPNTLGSIEYAFLEVTRKLIRSRQFSEERKRFVREIKRKLRSYLETPSKNFYSFRKILSE